MKRPTMDINSISTLARFLGCWLAALADNHPRFQDFEQSASRLAGCRSFMDIEAVLSEAPAESELVECIRRMEQCGPLRTYVNGRSAYLVDQFYAPCFDNPGQTSYIAGKIEKVRQSYVHFNDPNIHPDLSAWDNDQRRVWEASLDKEQQQRFQQEQAVASQRL